MHCCAQLIPTGISEQYCYHLSDFRTFFIICWISEQLLSFVWEGDYCNSGAKQWNENSLNVFLFTNWERWKEKKKRRNKKKCKKIEREKNERKIKETKENKRRKDEWKRKEISKVHKCRKAVHNPQINTVMLYQPELEMRDETRTFCERSALPWLRISNSIATRTGRPWRSIGLSPGERQPKLKNLLRIFLKCAYLLDLRLRALHDFL